MICDINTNTFTWTIKDFASRPEKTLEPIYSSSFLILDTNWQLMLYPNGNKDSEQGNYLSIYLMSHNDFPVKTNYQFSILDSKLKKRKTWKSRIKIFDEKNFGWGAPTWTLRKPLLKNQQLLREGNLTIHCELTIHGIRKISSGSRNIEDKSKTRAKGLEQASEQFGKLFTDKEFADVELECDGEVFHCHQLILSARSDVFRAMFQNDMKESRSKKVAIEDVDPKVHGEMLHYIYTGLTNKDLLEEKAQRPPQCSKPISVGITKEYL